MPSPELTRNQALVFGALEAENGPLSAYTILDRLREDGLRAPLQIYRALDKLLDLGLVHRLESINAFVACAHPGRADHSMAAFAICRECGRVQEFSDALVEKRLGAWADEHGFAAARTVVEMGGRCAGCAAREAAKASVSS